MSAATGLRAGMGCAGAVAERGAALVRARRRTRRDPDRARDQRPRGGSCRDELIALARESSEIALRELRRGLEDLDTFTRPDEEPAERASASLPSQAVSACRRVGAIRSSALGAEREIGMLREQVAAGSRAVDAELREPARDRAFAGKPKSFRPLTVFACPPRAHDGARAGEPVDRARVRGRAGAQHVADRRRHPRRVRAAPRSRRRCRPASAACRR